jgi:hypothetical protein
MARRKGNGRGFIKPYKTYLFRVKDPVIDELRTIKQDGGFTDAEVSRQSGVATGTLGNWWGGKTRRPQNASIEATGRAMGKKRVWVDMHTRRRAAQ